MQLKKLLEQRDRCTSSISKSDLTLEIAFYYTEEGDHSSALIEYRRNLDLWKSKDDKIQCAIAHRLVADCCIELGEFDQAIRHTNEYLKLSIESGNKLEQQRAFVTLGRCFLNRAEHLKDGADVLRSLKSASQAFLNSIKLIGELNSGLSAENLGEMRAVSLLNLGQVLRSMGDHRSSNERFLQCISLARKYHLPKLLFRACYQVTDLILCTYRDKYGEPCSKSTLLEHRKHSSLRHAMDIVSLALRYPGPRTCTDKESKELFKNLKETYAAIHLSMGSFRKASKVYRLLKLHSPLTSNACRTMIKKCMLLSKVLYSLPDHVPTSVDEHLLAARTHERLGDTFSELELNGLALNHYQFMLTHAEKAHYLNGSANSVDATTLAKLVDAALVSVAETFRALNDYTQCVQIYKREIQWVISTGLPTTELASSWFSMAQAQRLCFSSGPSTTPSSSLAGSETTLETLKHALQCSKQSANSRLTLEILTELEDYYTCHGPSEEAARIRMEINKCERSGPLHTDEEDEEAGEDDPRDDKSDESELDEDAVTQYIDTLSSDSEVDRCVGHSELLDELRGEKCGERKGKALCLKTNMKGETPLHVASINGDMDHVTKLIEVLGHPVNVTDGAGWLPIHEAAFHDRTEVAIYLLDRGAHLDDTGCPSDVSTPLFEAIHNGSLSTALVLVKRGANLWHINKRGECLPELLDMWQPRRRSAMSFTDQRLLFDELLLAIRHRLGDDYDRWCNQSRSNLSQLPRSSPSSSSSSSCSSPETHVVPKSPYPRLKAKRGRKESPSTMQVDVENVPRSLRDSRSRLRCRDGDDLVDLDITNDVTVLRERRQTPSRPQAVEAYKSAIQAVAGSSSRRGASENSAKIAPKRRTVAAIDADDDTWLVNDEISYENKRKRSFCITRPRIRRELLEDPTSHRRTKDDPAKLLASDSKCGGQPTVARTRPHDTSLEFCPDKSAFTSTQLADAPCSTSSFTTHHKQQDASRDPPLPKTPRSTSGATTQHALVTSAPTTTSVASTSTVPSSKPGSAPANVLRTDSVSLYGPLSVKVAFGNMSLLIPVDDSSRSVAWLADEAFRRRQILTSNAAVHSLGAREMSDLVRLSTRDGTLLLPTDRIHSVIAGLGPRGSVVELLAELVNETCDQLPCNSTPASRMTHAVRDSRATPSPVFVDPRVPTLQVPARYLPAPDKVSLIASSHFFKSLLDSTRTSQIVDLKHLALGEEDCGIVLDQLFLHGVRTVSELNLQGNCITLETPECRSFLIGAISRMTTRLTALDLSTNAITVKGLLSFLDELAQDLNSDQHLSSAPLLPRLQRLSLAHNPFIGMGGVKLDTEESAVTVDFLFLIGRLITHFPKLSHLHFADCCLGVSPTSHSHSVLISGCSISTLSELNLGWNSYISADHISTLLSSSALVGLRSLTLRGCSMPENERGHPTTLPLSPSQVAVFRWMNPVTKYATPKFSWSIPSRGDKLLNTLSILMSQSHFHLQTLDMGNCQLSLHCLDSLRSLFGTPGTSLTTVRLDRNPGLVECDPIANKVWCEVLRATALSPSALVSLSIDFPIVDADDDALSAATSAVEAKLLPGMSATPLQELVLVGAPLDWRPPLAVVASTDWGKCSVTNAHRFCNAVHNLFIGRFGNLTKCKIGENSITFGIL